MNSRNILHPQKDFGGDFLNPETRAKERKVLWVLIIINLIGMLAEILGGIFTNSLALLSDAAHMFTHLFSLVIAYLAIRLGMRSNDSTMTYGYFRMEILAAFFNGLTILVMVFLIVVEAIHKFISPTPILVREMIFVAIFGLVINLIGAWLLVGVAKKDINLRAVLFHLLSDTFSSIAILGGGILINYTDWFFIDGIASLIIATVVGFWGVNLIRSSSKILLQAVPEGINPEEVVKTILELPEVQEVHDVHIWELTSKKYVMTGHILTRDVKLSNTEPLLDRINHLVKDRFDIGHTTFQFEVLK